jgi:ribosomal-protein-alanine N-acetyltransferase
MGIRERLETALRLRWSRAKAPEGLPLRTNRLELRVLEERDWADMLLYEGDPAVLRYLSWSAPLRGNESHSHAIHSRAMTLAFTRDHLTLGIVRKSDSRLIGDISLRRIGSDHHLGFLIAKSAWGFGYGAEAADAIITFGFQRLEVRRVLAGCHPENAQSKRVLEKLGLSALPPRANFPHAPLGSTSLVFETDPQRWRASQKK